MPGLPSTMMMGGDMSQYWHMQNTFGKMSPMGQFPLNGMAAYGMPLPLGQDSSASGSAPPMMPMCMPSISPMGASHLTPDFIAMEMQRHLQHLTGNAPGYGSYLQYLHPALTGGGVIPTMGAQQMSQQQQQMMQHMHFQMMYQQQQMSQQQQQQNSASTYQIPQAAYTRPQPTVGAVTRGFGQKQEAIAKSGNAMLDLLASAAFSGGDV